MRLRACHNDHSDRDIHLCDRYLHLCTRILIFLFLSFFYSDRLWSAPIREGLEYQRQNTPNSQVVHILSIDPQKFNMISQHAKGRAFGLSTLSDLAKEQNAIAAINGGFFHMGDKKDGLPAGILKIQGQWYGIAYTNRAAVGWTSNSTNTNSANKSDQRNTPVMLIDRLQTKTTLKIKHQWFPIYALNQPGTPDRAVIYTQAYGKFADHNPGATDYIVQNNRIIGVNNDANETPIPDNGFIYSMGQNVKKPAYIPAIGDKVNFNIEVIPNKGGKLQKKLWQTMENIVGGTPLLVYNGQVVVSESQKHMQSPFASLRRARTALGIDPKGHWIWVVVENNPKDKKVGMTLLELAEFMKALGCVQALNLDGGSSSALYLEDKVVTAPEDDQSEGLLFPIMRRIGDAILVK